MAHSKPALKGGAALVLWGDVKAGDNEETALNDWWTNEHLPERMSVPGFLRARRYYARTEQLATSHYLTLYEAASLATLTSPAYMERLNNPTPGTQQYLPILSTMSRTACTIVHSEVRAELVGDWTLSSGLMGMLTMTAADEAAYVECLSRFRQSCSLWLQKYRPCIQSCTLLREDIGATAPGSASQSYLNANLKASTEAEGITIIVLFEFSGPDRAHPAFYDSVMDEAYGRLSRQRNDLSETLRQVYHSVAGISS